MNRVAMARMKFDRVAAVVLLAVLLISGKGIAQNAPAKPVVESDPVILFAPFVDESEFSGKWKLSEVVPQFLSAYISEKYHASSIPPASVQIFGETIGVTGIIPVAMLERFASHFRARYVVTAMITEFSIGRFIVAEQDLAGYESFSAEVGFSYKIYDAQKLPMDVDRALLSDGVAAGKVRDRALGITLFGKQTDRTNQYLTLDELPFGGERFNKTVIGEAMARTAVDFASKLEQAIVHLQLREIGGAGSAASLARDTSFALHRKQLNGEVLVVDSLEVFINLGSDDDVVVGQRLPVYSKGEQLRDPNTHAVLGESDRRVGEVQIMELRAPHLSLAVIIQGVGLIAPRQKVRVNVVR
ncbi:MAG: hypothetical protein NTV54_12015 [Ignavibacteriales bacterium]|nr:hypothetical protein [Ignavibacteriales bacterium]